MTEKKRVTIGLLLPSSTIMPMGKDFEKGVKKGLNKLEGYSDWDVDIVPEFIGQGGKEKILEAISKLLTYDDADIITGVISNKSVAEVAERFEKTKKPLLVNNLGEHLPDISRYNKNIFINSTNLWQQIWSLGNWGVKQFGKKGMIVSGLYDAGYSFAAMLQAGMLAADTEAVMPFAVAPVQVPGELADIKSVFQYIDQFDPDFVFAAFCGEEATLFLDEYIKRGLHKSKPLLGLPYLLQSFSEKDTIEIYTTISTQVKLEGDSLVSAAEGAFNPFPMLGYEAGLIIADALNEGGKKVLQDQLQGSGSISTRGHLNINPSLLGDNTHVYLVKNGFDGDLETSTRIVMEELPTVKVNDDNVQQLIHEFSTGWFNPYMGV